MPRRLLPVSPAGLSTYLDCPRRYRMAYLDRPQPPKGPPWAHNSFGASAHQALASWWKEPADRRTAARAAELLDAGWLVDGYRDDAQREGARHRAREMVARYAGGLDPLREPVGVERTVAVKTANAALHGRVDRIDDRGDDLVVVDYKTGRRPPTADDARSSVALAVYAAGAARTLHRQCHRVELHHLPGGAVVAWEHSDDGLARHLRRIDSLAAEIASLNDRFKAGVGSAEADLMYPPSPGPMCAWCDFNRSCPAAAVPPAQPWAGIDADS